MLNHYSAYWSSMRFTYLAPNFNSLTGAIGIQRSPPRSYQAFRALGWSAERVLVESARAPSLAWSFEISFACATKYQLQSWSSYWKNSLLPPLSKFTPYLASTPRWDTHRLSQHSAHHLSSASVLTSPERSKWWSDHQSYYHHLESYLSASRPCQFDAASWTMFVFRETYLRAFWFEAAAFTAKQVSAQLRMISREPSSVWALDC